MNEKVLTKRKIMYNSTKLPRYDWQMAEELPKIYRNMIDQEIVAKQERSYWRLTEKLFQNQQKHTTYQNRLALTPLTLYFLSLYYYEKETKSLWEEAPSEKRFFPFMDTVFNAWKVANSIFLACSLMGAHQRIFFDFAIARENKWK